MNESQNKYFKLYIFFICYFFDLIYMKNTECVKVVIRCRPLSSQEITDGRKMIVQMDTRSGMATIRNPKVSDEAPK